MADIYVRGLPKDVKHSLKRLAKRHQKTKRPSLNSYVIGLFEKHTEKEREVYKSRNGKA